jgi:hypothetical protein
LPQNIPSNYDPIFAAEMQRRAEQSQISAMLQANAYNLQTGFAPNSTYRSPQPFTSPNMFGQFSGAVGSIFGQEAGQMLQMAAPMLANPQMSGLLGPIPGMISAMQNSMPIGGGDVGAFAYGQLQSRLGRSLPPPMSLPTQFDSQARIDLYNDAQQQFAAFTGRANSSFPMQLKSLNAGDANSALNIGVQLSNVRSLQQSAGMKNTFGLYEAVTGQKVSDPALDQLINAQTDAQADALMFVNGVSGKKTDLGLKAEKILNNATKAAGFVNFTSSISKYAPMLSQAFGTDAAGITDMVEGLQSALGLDRDPSQFSGAAIQSMSMMGALGTARAGFDANGKAVFAADRVVGNLMGHLDDTSGKYAGMQKMGAGKSGTLMSELARSGILTSGGVDTYGSIKPEDVKRMEEAVSAQIEGMSEVVAAGKRIGMQISEVTQSMQRIYSGRLGQELSNEAGRIYSELDRNFVGPKNDDTRLFLQNEAQRKAGITIMQQVENAVQVGKLAGFDSKTSMAIMETASQLGEGLGLYGAAGISMGKNAMGRVGISRDMGTPMTIEQALAQEKDIMSKASSNSSVQAYAALKYAVSQGVLTADNPGVKSIFDAFNRGEDVSFEAASNLIGSTGAKLSTFTSAQGIRQGMSVRGVADDITGFYSSNENVSVYGSIKRSLAQGGTQGGLDIEGFATGLRANSKTAEALHISEEAAKRLNGLGFASAYNKLGSEEARTAALTALGITDKDFALIKSNLGDATGSFGVAGDKGESRVAAQNLEEEFQRVNNGGITNAEVKAGSITQVQQLLRGKYGNQNTQTAIATALDKTRQDKITKLMASNVVLTREQAEEEIDRNGFSLSEMLSSFSGINDNDFKVSIAGAKTEAEQRVNAYVTKTKHTNEETQQYNRDLKTVEDLNTLGQTREQDPAKRTAAVAQIEIDEKKERVDAEAKKDEIQKEKDIEREQSKLLAAKALESAASLAAILTAVNTMLDRQQAIADAAAAAAAALQGGP